eukprot:3073069-Rhodomonas_salina.3
MCGGQGRGSATMGLCVAAACCVSARRAREQRTRRRGCGSGSLCTLTRSRRARTQAAQTGSQCPHSSFLSQLQLEHRSHAMMMVITMILHRASRVLHPSRGTLPCVVATGDGRADERRDQASARARGARRWQIDSRGCVGTGAERKQPQPLSTRGRRGGGGGRCGERGGAGARGGTAGVLVRRLQRREHATQ